MTWDEFEIEIGKLSSKITFPIDVIVPIARGGLVPGRLLSSKLHVKTVYALTVVKLGQERHVVTEIGENLTNKNILLVEDILETGISMKVAKKYLEGKGALVKTVCLYTLPQAKIVPDYLLKKVSSLVSFPWE